MTAHVTESWCDRTFQFPENLARRVYLVSKVYDKASAEAAVPVREGQPHPDFPKLFAFKPEAVGIDLGFWKVLCDYAPKPPAVEFRPVAENVWLMIPVQ